jgi:hypothetical protein
VITMIEQRILEDERELEALCARFRAAKLALDRDGGAAEAAKEGRQPDEPGSAA